MIRRRRRLASNVGTSFVTDRVDTNHRLGSVWLTGGGALKCVVGTRTDDSDSSWPQNDRPPSKKQKG